MTQNVWRPLSAFLLSMSLTMSMLVPAHAQDSALPAVQTQGDVKFLSGGIGSDEIAAIKSASRDYPLTLQFSASTGAFLASVAVSIRDAAGKVVLDTVAEGPFLLVNLGPGRYRVKATLDGIERVMDVTLRNGAPQMRSMVWPPRRSDPEPRMVPSTGATSIVTPVPSMTTTAVISPSGAVTTITTPPTTSPSPPTPTASLPAQTTAGGVPYVTGGIGSDESAAIKAQFPKYAMSLTFASMQNGHNVFLASVPVKILDASGATVLDVTTGGPYLLVDVPPGRYEVVASHQGREQRGAVEVGPDRRAERAFVWSTP